MHSTVDFPLTTNLHQTETRPNLLVAELLWSTHFLGKFIKRRTLPTRDISVYCTATPRHSRMLLRFYVSNGRQRDQGHCVCLFSDTDIIWYNWCYENVLSNKANRRMKKSKQIFILNKINWFVTRQNLIKHFIFLDAKKISCLAIYFLQRHFHSSFELATMFLVKIHNLWNQFWRSIFKYK